MDNSYFIYSSIDKITIERFHNCTWEFDNNSSFVEFGFEIRKDTIQADCKLLEIFLYIPWLTERCELKDLYGKLKEIENAKFIFNDSVVNHSPINSDLRFGVVHEFSTRSLSFLPIELEPSEKIVSIKIDLTTYNESLNQHDIYNRFSIRPDFPNISTRKNGISKSTVIYDIKINEKRNIPDDLFTILKGKQLCEIKQCFNLNILPNSYDFVFSDSSLKSVRTLEYDSFKKYIGDRRIKKDELVVIFNKKDSKESYSFFSIYSKERIGVAQFSLAIFLNVFCSFLFFVGAYRTKPIPDKTFLEAIYKLPNEIIFAITIFFFSLVFLIWPRIKIFITRLYNCFISLFNKSIK